jgi:hypothetical protein
VRWQGKSYCGDKAVPQAGDQVLAPGVYRDTVYRYTGEGCDSIFYLQLHVNPIYDTDINLTICDNEKEHSFDLSDTQGTVINDDLPFTTSPSEEGVLKPTQYIERDYTLQTVHGCDSVVHLHLTVHPTYEFVTKVKICASENYKWRGEMYYVTGTYYDSLKTVNGCDSVYVLELFKKPMLLVPMYDTICDNETYQHKDTLWYTNGSYSLVETMVWTPGMTIPQTYSDIVFRSQDDGCDSVVYRYYLQINKTYTFRHTATICSNQSVETDEHTYTGYEFEFEPGIYRAPFDTVIYDRYSTVLGCDSVYELHATVYAAYRHCDTIMICDDATAVWRDHRYSDLEAGEYSFVDSYRTVLGCDSVYELKLIVHPTYFFEQHVDKCADEDMTWHDHNLDHLPVGDHFFYDSLTTASFGCDSVYHLYLTVKDTTNEFRHDTICRGEIYDFHGKPLTEAGYYHDTTLNAWGCHHFTYLNLEVIEPTVPTAWADSICADEDAYDLYIPIRVIWIRLLTRSIMTMKGMPTALKTLSVNRLLRLTNYHGCAFQCRMCGKTGRSTRSLITMQLSSCWITVSVLIRTCVARIQVLCSVIRHGSRGSDLEMSSRCTMINITEVIAGRDTNGIMATRCWWARIMSISMCRQGW